MKKKFYEKPSVEVVVINQKQMLMTSGVQSMRTDYDEPIEQTW